jgi:hypothetical protein
MGVGGRIQAGAIMIDAAMLRRLLTQCGMESAVIDEASLRVARAIWTAAQAEEREECATKAARMQNGKAIAAAIRARGTP